jgi:hypothetical protein
MCGPRIASYGLRTGGKVPSNYAPQLQPCRGQGGDRRAFKAARRLAHDQRWAERAEPCHQRGDPRLVVRLAPGRATGPHRHV